MDLFDLKGQRAIVTGASRGLGKGMAEGLLRAGCRVVLVGSSEKTEEAAAAFRAEGLDAYAVQGNLGDRGDLQDIFEKAMAWLGGIDILVNSAGVQRRHPPEEFPAEDWDWVIAVNLDAVFFLSQLCVRPMLAQGHGKIINIASMCSWFGGLTIPAYTASKGAIAQLTKSMASDLGGRGIQVNAIAPGYMATDMNERLLENPERLRQISERIPAGRWGTPEDMIGPVLFLASHASDYLNGAVIPVDGGYLTR
ncbi:MAG: glucose 1-dehydrogenase [Provencibacterium sp.]|nr:glucose 1-dehydrogenase [Provencibacterium sp.]